MDGCIQVATARGQRRDLLPGIAPDILNGPVTQDLVFDAPAEETQILAELSLQTIGLHSLRCVLNRIQPIDPDLNEVGNELRHRSIGVDVYPGVCLPSYVLHQAFQPGPVDAAECLR